MPDTLQKLIIEKIRQSGPITFRDFMEMALYYPGLGYYTSAGEKIGKTGDYYTSPHVSSIFGEFIAKQMEEMWEILGRGDFTIVEPGAGKGLLAFDILSYLKERPIFSHLHYVIVETSPELIRVQRSTLGGFGDKVSWSTLSELSGINGCFISNELMDALPVHVVVQDNGLNEIYVGWSRSDDGNGNEDAEGHFIEIKRPVLSDSRLSGYFSELGVMLEDGFRTEVNLDAIDMIQDIGKALKRGFVITIDYGYPSSELYQPERSCGTLMCYHKHTVIDDPYRFVGSQDITSHVNFSALVRWGRKAGLELTGFTDQCHFLLGLGLEEYLKDIQKKDYNIYLKTWLPIKNLFMPQGMGEVFKVLIQHKGIERPELGGLRYTSGWAIEGPV